MSRSMADLREQPAYRPQVCGTAHGDAFAWFLHPPLVNPADVSCSAMRLVVIGALAACGGSSPSKDISCKSSTNGTLSVTSAVTANTGDDLHGAAIAADEHVTLPSQDVTISCAT